jgi:hypothetical protein
MAAGGPPVYKMSKNVDVVNSPSLEAVDVKRSVTVCVGMGDPTEDNSSGANAMVVEV